MVTNATHPMEERRRKKTAQETGLFLYCATIDMPTEKQAKDCCVRRVQLPAVVKG